MNCLIEEFVVLWFLLLRFDFEDLHLDVSILSSSGYSVTTIIILSGVVQCS